MITDFFDIITSLSASTIRLSIPLILAAMAGMMSERSGIVNVGLEGKMLLSAFAAAATASVTNDAWLGLLAGIAVAVLLSLLHGLACITYNGNQVVSGMAINILAAGLAPTLANAWFKQGGQTPILSGESRHGPINLPGTETIGDIPVISNIYKYLISGHSVLVYITLAIPFLMAWILYSTRFGLRLRAAGENPHALDTAGVSVSAVRYRGQIACGILCGIAGAYLATAQNAAFSQNMTAGRGYLALAALIFGRWRPKPTLLACFLFAFTDAIQIRLQGTYIPGIGIIPVQMIQALPYLLTVLLLAGFIGKSEAPKALGIPFVKDR